MRVRLAEFLRSIFYGALVVILTPLVWSLFRITVQGRKNLRVRGIVVARHRSYWDILILGIACGPFRRLNFLARRTLLRHPLFAPIVWALATVIDRDDFRRQDFRRALQSADRARLLGVFPEGTTRAGTAPKSGALRFADRLNRALIPVNIVAHGPYPPRYPFHFPRIEVRIGTPLGIDELTQGLPQGLNRSERYRLLAERLMGHVDSV
ncbi:MAG: lysophospholipid acyltransferase family protein [Candidatus Bipolaricaulota bacterium]